MPHNQILELMIHYGMNESQLDASFHHFQNWDLYLAKLEAKTAKKQAKERKRGFGKMTNSCIIFWVLGTVAISLPFSKLVKDTLIEQEVVADSNFSKTDFKEGL